MISLSNLSARITHIFSATNMTASERSARILIGLLLIWLGGTENIFLSIIGLLLFGSGSSGMCFFYTVFGINRTQERTSYYLSKLPMYNPEPVFIFHPNHDMLFQNNASKRILPKIKNLEDIFIQQKIKEMIENGETISTRVKAAEMTYLLVGRKAQDEEIILTYGFNITDIVKSEQRLKEEALTDKLTGYGNRKKLLEEIEACSEKNYMIILVDIKGFGQINSFYGHKQGDNFIKNFASALKKCVRKNGSTGSIYRLHGDVFALMSTSDSEGHALQELLEDTIDTVLTDIRELEINMGALKVSPEFTLGAASTGFCPDSPEKKMQNNVLNRAETALIEAKLRGLGSLKYCDINNIEEKYKENIYWTKKIKDVIAKTDPARVVPFFQPIYNIKTRQIEKFECLVRMIENDEPIPPYKFLEPAKNVGLMPNLTSIVMEEAFKSFHGSGYEFSVNITAQDMSERHFLTKLDTLADQYNIQPSQVVMEILEDEDMYEYIECISALKEKGYKIAIDDFGSGYSNFSKLQQIHADYVKIDGSLIKDIDKSESHRKLLKPIVNYAQSIGASTIAEYVSHEAIYALLEENGIDYAQGFYVGKPLPHIHDLELPERLA